MRNELEDRTAKLLQFELNASLSAIDEEQAPEWVFYDYDDGDDHDHDGDDADADHDDDVVKMIVTSLNNINELSSLQSEILWQLTMQAMAVFMMPLR